MAGRPVQWLRQEIRASLVPAIRAHGFDLRAPENVGGRDWQSRKFLPFGVLERRTDGGVELIEIQLRQWRLDQFRINFGIVPCQGIRGLGGEPIPESKVSLGWLSSSFELRPRWRGWFSVVRYPFRKVDQGTYAALVTGVVEMLPEVFEALASGRCGPHVRRIGSVDPDGTGSDERD